MSEGHKARKVTRPEIVAEAAARHRNPILRRLARRFARAKKDQVKNPVRANALPEALLETAQIPGYDKIRVWGDVYSPQFEELLIEKNRQVHEAARSGAAPDGLRSANFLAISGGGDKGAFAAGVLAGWGQRGDRPKFEVVTGVSAGALAAPFAFIERDLCLEEVYTEYGGSHLYKSRGLRGFFSDALNDTMRLETLIGQYVTDLFLDQIAEERLKGRRLLVLTTNLDAQRQVIWDLSAIAASERPDRRDLFVKVLLASSALPGVFPPVKIDVVAADGNTYNELHVDGGVTAELVFIPPESQIMHIEDMFFEQRRQRTLFVLENGKLGPEYHSVDLKILPLALRAVQTMVKYQVIDNLLALALISRNNGSRFFFNAIPSSFSPKPHALFDREHAKELFAVGRDVGLSGKWFTSPPSSPTLLPTEEVDVASPRSIGRRGCMQFVSATGGNGGGHASDASRPAPEASPAGGP